MQVIPNYTFRPKQWIYYCFIILGIGGIIICCEDAVITRKEYLVLGSSLFLIIWAILSLKRLLIIVDNYGITHRQIFKETFIDWNEIKAVDIKTKVHQSGPSLFWAFERFDKSLHQIDFVGRDNMHLLAKAVLTKCTKALISDKVKRFATDKNISLILN